MGRRYFDLRYGKTEHVLAEFRGFAGRLRLYRQTVVFRYTQLCRDDAENEARAFSADIVDQVPSCLIIHLFQLIRPDPLVVHPLWMCARPCEWPRA